MKRILTITLACAGNLVLIAVLMLGTQSWFGDDRPPAAPYRAQAATPSVVGTPAPVAAPAPTVRVATAPSTPPGAPAPVQPATSAPRQPMTFVSWGGGYQEAQREVFFAPFAETTNTAYQEDTFGGTMGEIRDALNAGKPWDVVDVEFSDVQRGCEEGLWERIDWNRIRDRNDFLPTGIQDCGVGFIVWSFVLVYNPQTVARAPVSWSDLWSTDTIPGKRGLRDQVQWLLEIALMADGVAVTDVYTTLATPAGVDRAFAKLDQIKPDIVWWDEGSTPTNLLTEGEVVMMTGNSGASVRAQMKGEPVEVLWHNIIYTMDFWVIRKGSPNIDSAYDFINFAMTPEVIAKFPERRPYGPVNLKAVSLIEPGLLKNMPTAPQNIKNALLTNVNFWNTNGAALEQRFQNWKTK